MATILENNESIAFSSQFDDVEIALLRYRSHRSNQQHHRSNMNMSSGNNYNNHNSYYHNNYNQNHGYNHNYNQYYNNGNNNRYNNGGKFNNNNNRNYNNYGNNNVNGNGNGNYQNVYLNQQQKSRSSSPLVTSVSGVTSFSAPGFNNAQWAAPNSASSMSSFSLSGISPSTATTGNSAIPSPIKGPENGSISSTSSGNSMFSSASTANLSNGSTASIHFQNGAITAPSAATTMVAEDLKIDPFDTLKFLNESNLNSLLSFNNNVFNANSSVQPVTANPISTIGGSNSFAFNSSNPNGFNSTLLSSSSLDTSSIGGINSIRSSVVGAGILGGLSTTTSTSTTDVASATLSSTAPTANGSNNERNLFNNGSNDSTTIDFKSSSSGLFNKNIWGNDMSVWG